MRSFKIITFGCRLNQAESREIGEKLVRLLDYKVTRLQEADIVIINTCCVTKKAEREVRKEIRKVKRENPDCFLVVAGCWVNKLKTQNANLKATTQKSKLFGLMDLLISNEEKKNITKILKRHFKNLAIKPRKAPLRGRQYSNRIYQDKYARSKKALIKIQDGCDNFCSFCIVPYVRGKSRSRPTDEIIKEIKQKIKEGIEEIVLTGINLGDYDNLARLIRRILQETHIQKISFGSMPLEIVDKNFFALYQDKNLASHLTRYFHIPLQSGCNKTLKRMGRKYDVDQFKSQIAKLKTKIPNFTFSTDIIVGFPGETREEFEETLKTLKEIKKILGKDFTKIHIFRYSPREGTLAAKMKEKWGRVEEREKKRRVQAIMHLFNTS